MTAVMSPGPCLLSALGGDVFYTAVPLMRCCHGSHDCSTSKLRERRQWRAQLPAQLSTHLQPLLLCVRRQTLVVFEQLSAGRCQEQISEASMPKRSCLVHKFMI